MNRPSRARRLRIGIGVLSTIIVGALAASYQACTLYSSSLLAPLDSGQGGSGASSGCDRAVPPARPAVSDEGGSDIGPVIAAFETIDIGLGGTTADGGPTPLPPFGYDLDGVCTCPGLPSCQQASKTAPESCDDDAGRDHAAITLFRYLGAAASTGTSQIDQGLMAGQYGILLVIKNYNGLQNDSRVTVDFFVSNGLNRDPDGGVPTPQFDGNDQWTIDPGSGTLSQPVFSDDSAYVSNGTVVANMSQPIPIAFGDRSFLGGATMILSSAVIVGSLQLVPVGGDAGSTTLGFSLQQGTIAGRWGTGDLLSTLATIPSMGGGFLCGADSVPYQLIKATVCGSADISKNPLNDNGTPLAQCDAVSVGLQFTAAPAQLGNVLAVPAAPAGCQVDGKPFTDTCQQ
ncbi:MAG TPA: hypothetical protein VH044_02410 [Polyangiaceae bacterium]|nr:hypothetical protein [Polyangiaceae bacterium]